MALPAGTRLGPYENLSPIVDADNGGGIREAG
jgi:hypothetical protein